MGIKQVNGKQVESVVTKLSGKYKRTPIVSNEYNNIPICVNEGCNRKCCYSGNTSDGHKRYRAVCDKCHKATWDTSEGREMKQRVINNGIIFKNPHSVGQDGYCANHHGAVLGPDNPCPYPQPLPKDVTADIDHIDGDYYNNTWENTQVLCRDCHKQKSVKYGDTPGHTANRDKKFQEKDTPFNKFFEVVPVDEK